MANLRKLLEQLDIEEIPKGEIDTNTAMGLILDEMDEIHKRAMASGYIAGCEVGYKVGLDVGYDEGLRVSDYFW